jgi:hypothetical protein
MVDARAIGHKTRNDEEGRRKKEEGRRKKEEGSEVAPVSRTGSVG